jgi:hypothetical protein
MSTQIETGQTYAPSAGKPSGRWMPWLVGGVVAVVAIAATLAVSATVESEPESAAAVNSAELTQAGQAQGFGSTFMREPVRALQAEANSLPSEYIEDTAIIPVEVNLSGSGFIGQDAALDEVEVSVLAKSSVLTPIVSQQLQGFVDRLSRQEAQASSGASAFSPEAVRGQGAVSTKPDIWVQSSDAETDFGGATLPEFR